MEIEQYSLFDFIDYHKEADDVFGCLAELDRSVTIKLLTQILQGQRTKYIMRNKFYHLASYGNMANKTQNDISLLVRLLIERGFLQCKRIPNGKISVLLSKKGLGNFRSNRPMFFIDIQISNEELTILEKEQCIYDRLRHFRILVWKNLLAEYPDIKPYHIARNDTLHEIVKRQPNTLEELSKIGDMNENKIKKFGKHILKIIKEDNN